MSAPSGCWMCPRCGSYRKNRYTKCANCPYDRAAAKAVIALAATLFAFVCAPSASADSCTGVMNQGNCKPAPWNGQLQDTWNTPGYYGGWTNGPVQCNPFTTQCVGWAQP